MARVGPIAPVGMLINYLKADQIILLRQKKGGLNFLYIKFSQPRR